MIYLGEESFYGYYVFYTSKKSDVKKERKKERKLVLSHKETPNTNGYQSKQYFSTKYVNSF
jgi:hypothetical protein